MKRYIRQWWLVLLIGATALVLACFIIIADYIESQTYEIDTFWFYSKAIAAGISFLLYIIGTAISNVRYLEQIRKSAQTKLQSELTQAIAVLIPTEFQEFVRANIMILNKKGRLNIFSSYNMEGYDDISVELDIGQGCAGVAWENAIKKPASIRGVPTVEPDLAAAGQYGMTAGQKKQTEHVKWIVSTPICHSDNAKVIGMFNIDGLKKMEDDFFDNQELGIACITWANIVAQTLQDNGLT